jgi:hypothetical protein
VPDVGVQDHGDVEHAERVGDRLVLGHLVGVRRRGAADEHAARVLEPAGEPQPVEGAGDVVGAVLAGLEVDDQALVGVGPAERGDVGVGRAGHRRHHLEAPADEHA